MHIRRATEQDIPSIIQLLKESLGESLIPKTEMLWRWKHLENPFGPSPVLLAEEDGKLVGVRAFLRWEFINNSKTYKACRAVDTATHPDFWGKGIFKKLTLQLIHEIKADGVDFIYNTPNSQSTPGYLKMGWDKWGKLPLKLQFHINSGINKHPLEPEPWDEIQALAEQIEKESSNEDGSHLITGYLKWRYQDCPLFPYYFLTDSTSYLLFYGLKEGKLGRELRICDLFTTESFNNSSHSHLQEQLNLSQEATGARFTSFSGLKYARTNPDSYRAIKLGNLPTLKIGPLVTLREVNSNPLDKNWSWSLGDLELF